VLNRWNSLDQETVVGSINSFKGRLDKIRKTRMGFYGFILHGPQSPRPHGDGTPVRPHKVSYKVTYTDLSSHVPIFTFRCIM